MFRNLLGGIYFISLIFLTTFFGSIFMVGPLLPLLFFKPSWFRYISDKLLGSWLYLPPAVLEMIFGMKVFITTEDLPSNLRNDRAVIMMNHRTRLDWLYYWSVIFRQGKLENEKIILKNELKQIPGAGWVMQIAMFIFLKRNWDTDEKYLHQILHYFSDINYPLQLLIFPEGTDFNMGSVAKSTSYALKNNLPIYKHVLHPRLRGLTYCVEQLRASHGIDAIYDVTIGYRGNLCQSEFDLAMGHFPNDVHFHIKRYPISSIPESTEGLEKWCMERWDEKETTLDKFYKDGKFVPEREQKSVVNESSVRYQMIFWIVYWTSFLLGVVLMFWYYFWWVLLYTVIVGGFLFIQSAYGDGFEMLQARSHEMKKYNENNSPAFSQSKYIMQNGTAKNHEA